MSDGAGGAVIGWNDYRSGPSDIYAQRLDGATGAAQWISQGVAVSTAAGDQIWPVQFFPMVADGSGGAILTWTDARGGSPSTPPPNIYAQRVNDEDALGLRPTFGFWRFEEGNGATTTDWSGNGYTGYLDGLVAFTMEAACDSIQGRPNDYAMACSPNPLPDPGYGGLSIGGWPTRVPDRIDCAEPVPRVDDRAVHGSGGGAGDGRGVVGGRLVREDPGETTGLPARGEPARLGRPE